MYFFDSLVLFLPPDLTHLVKSEVPVKPTLYTQSTEENVGNPKVRKPRAISDPCQPNPCHNGGLCVGNQGKATCRLVHLIIFLSYLDTVTNFLNF